MLGAIAHRLFGRPPANLGQAGERCAARWLRRRGYRVLGRNVRVGVGEADIVCLAPDRRTIVIVEVKTRRVKEPRGFAPEVAVNAAKRRKLEQVAQALIRKKNWTDRPVRIEAVAVAWPDRGRPRVRLLALS